MACGAEPGLQGSWRACAADRLAHVFDHHQALVKNRLTSRADLFFIDKHLMMTNAANDFTLTKFMVWGNWAYVLGGNPEAARPTGILVRNLLFSV